MDDKDIQKLAGLMMKMNPNLEEKKKVCRLYIRRIQEKIDFETYEDNLNRMILDLEMIFSSVHWGYL